jgi:hypothetical protein
MKRQQIDVQFSSAGGGIGQLAGLPVLAVPVTLLVEPGPVAPRVLS